MFRDFRRKNHALKRHYCAVDRGKRAAEIIDDICSDIPNINEKAHVPSA